MNSAPSETDLELFAKVEQSPPGTFRLFRAAVGVEANIRQHLSTMDELGQRVGHAWQSGCLIEVIAIELQVIDFWLRVFLSNTAGANDREGIQFGHRVQLCVDAGFDASLAKRVGSFNDGRIQAIHGYVIGTIDYQRLSSVAVQGGVIVRETAIAVVESRGEVASHRDHLAAGPGSMVMNVAGFVAEIRDGRRYERFP
jgi:hypothetical protein